MSELIDYLMLPKHMQDGMQRYVEHGVRPGSFLYLILCNDFVRARGHADQINAARMGDYARFLGEKTEHIYLWVPHRCWGSAEKVEKWIERKRELREVGVAAKKVADE